VSKCNCSSQKPLLTTGIWTRDIWFRSLGLRPLDKTRSIHLQFNLCFMAKCLMMTINWRHLTVLYMKCLTCYLLFEVRSTSRSAIHLQFDFSSNAIEIRAVQSPKWIVITYITYIHYIPLTLYPPDSRSFSDIPPRRQRFTKIIYL
jgi:hypothetical protein